MNSLLHKLRIINQFELKWTYNKPELIDILRKEFDTSNLKTTTFKNNRKTFQIQINSEDFTIWKIDKFNDSSDPTYMALTHIRGTFIAKPDNKVKLLMNSEIHPVWSIFLLAQIVVGILGVVFYSLDFTVLILSSLFLYLALKYLAMKDFYKFVGNLIWLIKPSEI